MQYVKILYSIVIATFLLCENEKTTVGNPFNFVIQ